LDGSGVGLFVKLLKAALLKELQELFSQAGTVASASVVEDRMTMINLDPDTAKQEDGRVLKSVVRLNANNAGVYGTVVQTGTLHVGQTVNLIFD
jgi:hypothetical protein